MRPCLKVGDVIYLKDPICGALSDSAQSDKLGIVISHIWKTKWEIYFPGDRPLNFKFTILDRKFLYNLENFNDYPRLTCHNNWTV